MVFQHAELLPWLSAMQNVMFGLEMKGMRGAPLRDTAEKYLELVGLTDSKNRRPHQLSGGMKQRVGIARALAIDPNVLLMDEPFGALDAQTRETLQAELLEIHARTKKTILFVTHDLDEAVLIADRIVVMKDGRVQEIIERAARPPAPRSELVRGLPEFSETRYKIWRAARRRRRCTDRWPISPTPRIDRRAAGRAAERRPLPRWVITIASVGVAAGAVGDLRPRHQSDVRLLSERDRGGVLGSAARPGNSASALFESLQPFVVGYGLAIVIGVPLGLVIGRFRTAEAALGIYVTAGYAMPLVALVPLLILWLGLGFAVKVAVVFLMSLFPICINTWLGVVAVPKTLIEVGKSFVAPDLVILRRIILPATLPYIMAGIRLAVGRAVVAMVIAEFFTTISGLGAVIINSANNFDTATMFVPIIILMLMAVGLNSLIGLVERNVAPWQAEIAGRDRE